MPADLDLPLPVGEVRAIVDFVARTDPAVLETITQDERRLAALVKTTRMAVSQNEEEQLAGISTPPLAAAAVSANGAASASANGAASASDNTTDATETADPPMREIVAQPRGDPPPPIFLDGTNFSSAEFTNYWNFSIFCGSDEAPLRINFIAQIITNRGNKKVGSTRFRLAHIDLGNNKRTCLVINFGTVLYQIDNANNPLPEGSIVVFRNLEGHYRGGKPALKFTKSSSAHRLLDPNNPTWDDVKAWQKKLAERDMALYLEEH